jgi:predicted acetyltransferase
MNYEIKRLSAEDGHDIYEMLQEMPPNENGFVNSNHGRTFDEYGQWLIRSAAMSQGIGLESWMVPQTTYWLYVDGLPVGMGRIRHFLTEKLQSEGGHTGYAIRPSQRGNGYGKLLLGLLRPEAKKLGIDEMLLTIWKTNEPSIRTALACGGVIKKSSDERHYIWIPC